MQNVGITGVMRPTVKLTYYLYFTLSQENMYRILYSDCKWWMTIHVKWTAEAYSIRHLASTYCCGTWKKYLQLEYATVQHHWLEMWANAQRGGRPAEYRWRPLFNAAKFGWRPLLECRAVMVPRRETRWNVLGCPKLTNRSQPLVGWSSPYCETLGRHCCFTSFFSDCWYMP